MHFNKRSRLKKRLPVRVKQPLEIPLQDNIVWLMDFMSDSLDCGRRFRVLNIIDDYNREAVCQEISVSFPADRLIRVLEKVIWVSGKPQKIRTDNGPEFISTKFAQWCAGNSIELIYTQPGKPMQNGYIERFNGSFRKGVLDAHIFRTLDEARAITQQWQEDYNNHRPHMALGNMLPKEYKTINSAIKNKNNKFNINFAV